MVLCHTMIVECDLKWLNTSSRKYNICLMLYKAIVWKIDQNYFANVSVKLKLYFFEA